MAVMAWRSMTDGSIVGYDHYSILLLSVLRYYYGSVLTVDWNEGQLTANGSTIVQWPIILLR